MKLKTWLTGWILSFCISFGVLSALVTAFELYDVSLPDLGIYLSLLCALSAGAFLTKRGPVFLFSFMGVLLGCSLLWQGLWRSVQAVAYELSTYYDAAYGCGVFAIPEESEAFSQIPAVFFLGTLPAISLTWTICRQEKLLLPLAIALLPLYPCFVVIDTQPESWCFLLVLTAVLMLVLTQSLRRQSHRQGHRITAFALIPVVLLSALLTTVVPEEGYWDTFPRLKEWMQPSTEGQTTTPSYIGMPTGNQQDLSQLGPMPGTNQTVMVVRSATRGFLYLRYQSFDSYTGTQWLATDIPEDAAFWPEEEDLAPLGYTTITTSEAYDGLFIPYYARNGRYLLLQKGKQPNVDKLTRYRIAVGILREDSYATVGPDLTPYLDLPKDTREAALKILQENALKTPEDILQYVQNSAAYDLNTPAMPEGTEDFALWFLQSSDTGYCVHFASAAAVLLRAAGYPARYVTGYALYVPSRQNSTVSVKENHAHAWVEYGDPENGYLWQVFEATPGDFADDPTPSPSTAPTSPSDPSQPATETQHPTQPSTDSQPSTQPSQLPGSFPSETGTSSAATRPTQATQPQASEKTPLVMSWLWPWLIRLGCLFALVVSLWLQYRIRYRLRQKKLRIGTPNAQALTRWQEILRLSRLLKTEPPEALLELAEKARFSQHTVSKEELFRLGQYLQQQRTALQKLPVWKRLFLKLILAI